MSNPMPTPADAARAADTLQKHCPIHDVTLTSAPYWEVEYVEVIETETETRGPDGPYMREYTERRRSFDDGHDLEELVDLLQTISADENLEYLHLYLPTHIVNTLL